MYYLLLELHKPRDSFWEWVKRIARGSYTHMIITRHMAPDTCEVSARVYVQPSSLDDIVYVIQLVAHNAVGITDGTLHLSEWASKSVTLADLQNLRYTSVYAKVSGRPAGQIGGTIEFDGPASDPLGKWRINPATPVPVGSTGRPFDSLMVATSSSSSSSATAAAPVKERLVFLMELGDGEAFGAWLEARMEWDSPLLFRPNYEQHVVKVFARSCAVDLLYKELSEAASAPGVRLLVFWYSDRDPLSMKPDGFCDFAKNANLSIDIKGKVTELDSTPPPPPTPAPDPNAPPPPPMMMDDVLMRTLLLTVGLILDRGDVLGLCRACANDAEYTAEPCDDSVYCRACMKKHASCTGLAAVCPVCRRADVTFVNR